MNVLSEIYSNSLAANERNLRFWEDYLQNLKSLDFDVYSEKLKVPVLVPIGSRVLFRGELKHTNEVTVALGADYFAKCSLKQAEILRQHRIRDAESKVETFRKEREYLNNQLSFSKQTVFENEGQEVIEVHTEDEDRAWREKHRENVRRWKQKKEDQVVKAELTDEELWERLEELELQEELDNELGKETETTKEKDTVIQEETLLEKNNVRIKKDKVDAKSEHTSTFSKDPKTYKFELFQKVIDKQNELEEKLLELKNKDRSKSTTEQDLFAKLDEMDELEELQDEMDRLEDIIETEDKSADESEEETLSSSSQTVNLKRRVSFADEDDSETLELAFHHTDVEPSINPYDPNKGITKPSDIYEAYSNLFVPETTSILKKKRSTHDESKKMVNTQPKKEKPESKSVDWPEEEVRTIVVEDVLEKIDVNENRLENTEKRPASLFKQRRQQKK